MGQLVEPLVRATIKDCVRSIKRGLGPSALKDSFDVWQLVAQPDEEAVSSFDHTNLWHALDVVVLGCWFMLRELELSAARVPHMYLEDRQVHILLPVHKTQQAGSWTARTLSCACSSGRLMDLCPWHSAHRHLRRVRLHDHYRDQVNFPLVPTRDGSTMSKVQVIEMIMIVLKHSDIETTRPDEQGIARARFGGHCLRVSGAQFLSAAGVQVQLVQLLGRWSSLAAQRYVQQAPLAVIPGLPQQVLLHQDAEDPFELARQALFPSRSASQPSMASVPSTPVPPTLVQTVTQQDPTHEARLSSVEQALLVIQQAIASPSDNWVVRRRSKIVRLGQSDENAMQPTLWRSRCGWAYGTANFFRVTSLQGGYMRCRKCFPDGEARDPEGSDLDDESQSADSSGSSSESQSEDP